MSKPLALDLFCGLGGWAQGLLATGYDVVGYDLEAHEYTAVCAVCCEGSSRSLCPVCRGTGLVVDRYPGQLECRDVRTLHGCQFADAALIVASPPCQAYSYRAMPWKKAKALPPPDNSLFEACFRIQREASQSAGRRIPLVVENVKGAQPWVGRAKAHYGSYYLWGDINSVGGRIVVDAGFGAPSLRAAGSGGRKRPGQNWSHYAESGAVSPDWGAVKGMGGTWFGRKVDHHLGGEVPKGTGATSWYFGNTKHELRAGVKLGGPWWSDQNGIRRYSSGSAARKEASARIAKIPSELAEYIGRSFYPSGNKGDGELKCAG